MWVPLVENNEIDTEGARFFVKRHLDHLLAQSPHIDSIILACTHFPLLLPLIEEFTPKQVRLIAQGSIVANRLKDYLVRHPELEEKCSKEGKHRFFTTENPENFNDQAAVFYGKSIEAGHIDIGH